MSGRYRGPQWHGMPVWWWVALAVAALATGVLWPWVVVAG